MRRMTASLAHRGPDDEAYYRDEHIAIGFRRLSIVDVDGGRQPLSNEANDLILACNGEIYNSPELRKRLEATGHRFKTKSDVEVILHLYEEQGLDCVKQLEGMFAFALWDATERRLVLARDHMGQKPMFFHQSGGQFIFASEIQALTASDAFDVQLDLDALWHYLSLRFMPDCCCLVKDVQKLPAAHYLTLKDGQIQMRRYWRPSFVSKLELCEGEAIDALDEILHHTVRSHLLSDVTVGSFISGGIDSTTVASLMAGESRVPVPVFCIGVDEAAFDEMPIAEKVARARGMDFSGRRVKPDIVSLLPKLVHHLGEPADPYGVGVYLVSELAAQRVKVVLSGDGGDESFGGYDRYLGQRMVDIFCWLPRPLRRVVFNGLIACVPETFQYKSVAQRLKWMKQMAEYTDGQRYARALGFLRFTPETKAELFSDSARSRLSDTDSIGKVLEFFDSAQAVELTDRMLYSDLMTRVPDHNLVMGDRMSMACSLEVRSPFVDPRVVEFAASLPTSFKIKGRQLKYLLRRVAARYVPDEVVRLPKQGFGFPLGQWIRHDLRETMQRRLRRSKLVDAGIFNRDYLIKLLDEHMAGQEDHSYRLWLLLGLEVWYDLYVEGGSVDSVLAEMQ